MATDMQITATSKQLIEADRQLISASRQLITIDTQLISASRQPLTVWRTDAARFHARRAVHRSPAARFPHRRREEESGREAGERKAVTHQVVLWRHVLVLSAYPLADSCLSVCHELLLAC